MKKILIAIVLTILLASSVVSATDGGPACGNVQYEKTYDFVDGRVTIDFKDSSTRITITGSNGWAVSKVWLDVTSDNQNGYVPHASGPVTDYNPAGNQITKVKVEVKKACATPTPTPSQSPSPSATPSATPTPSASPTPTPEVSETPVPSQTPELTPTPSESPEVTPEPSSTPESTPEATPTPQDDDDGGSDNRRSSGGGSGMIPKCSEAWLRLVQPNDPACVSPTPVVQDQDAVVYGVATESCGLQCISAAVPTGPGAIGTLGLSLITALTVTAGAAVRMLFKR